MQKLQLVCKQLWSAMQNEYKEQCILSKKINATDLKTASPEAWILHQSIEKKLRGVKGERPPPHTDPQANAVEETLTDQQMDELFDYSMKNGR